MCVNYAFLLLLKYYLPNLDLSFVVLLKFRNLSHVQICCSKNMLYKEICTQLHVWHNNAIFVKLVHNHTKTQSQNVLALISSLLFRNSPIY